MPSPDLRPAADPAIAAPADPDAPRLGPDDDGRVVSAADFAAATCDGPWTYERIEGRLGVMSPEGKDHAKASTPWLLRLGAYALAHPDRVQAVVPAPWVRIDGATDRIGDIGVYLGGRLDDLNLPDQVPDLMFEFVSLSPRDRRRDYVEKRADYARAGVAEYVIVDRIDRRVTFLTLGEGGYAERAIPAGGTYRSPLLPGLAIGLGEVGLG